MKTADQIQAHEAPAQLRGAVPAFTIAACLLLIPASSFAEERNFGFNFADTVAGAGIGSVKQRKIEFRPYESAPGGEKCRVALEFDSKWASIKISDNGECNQFQGASCSWDGDTVRRKRD